MMNVNTMVSALNQKCTELDGMLDRLQEDGKSGAISQNTVRTQTFQKKHELHNLLIMRELCQQLLNNGKEEIQLHQTIIDWFESITTLSATRKAKYEVEVHAGDTVMSLLQKYTQVKDVWVKIQKEAEKKGLKNVDGVFKK